MSIGTDPISQLAAAYATEPLLVTDSEQVRFVNQAFADLVGVPYSELIGRGIDQIVTILSEPMVLERLRSALRQHQPFRGEASVHTADGGTIPIDLTVIPVDVEGEELFVVSGLDLRRRKRLEHQLWQSQRLDAVTQLADGIAHEMNEAIQVLSGFASLASGGSTRALTASDLSAIDRAARRASTILGELFEFARRRPVARTAIDLNGLVAAWESLLQGLLGTSIRFIVDLTPDLPLIRADRGELQQVLINLLTNARDAMPEGGTLTISTHLVEPDGRIDPGDLDAFLGSYVVLTVSDTGTGMNPETKAQLFEPFFTTKDKPGTRGLGLATVQDIVREAGGLIWVRSQPGQGTSVEVHFPALAARPDRPTPVPPNPKPGRGTETILLVDDDPGVLAVARRGLEKYGYRVFPAASAAEATALATERGGEIALLVTDVMMPGQRGTGLARELVDEWPHLRVLFMTGYPGEADAVARKAPYLTKPFSPDDLARAVRAIFDA